MKRFLPAALAVAGLLILVALGFLFKAALGRTVVAFLLAFVGLSLVVSLLAFLLFVFTLPLDTSYKE